MMNFFNKYRNGDSEFVTPGKQLDFIAQKKPNDVAIISIDKNDIEEKLTWKELQCKSNQVANYLIDMGIGSGDTVLVSFPNGLDHIIATFAIWKAGACYTPISYKTGAVEMRRIHSEVKFKIDFSNHCQISNCINITSKKIKEIEENVSDETPPDRVANPNMISLSGGTSGKLKIIKQNMPSGLSDDLLKSWFQISGMDFDERQLLTGPLSHGAPHSAAFNGLFSGNQLVIIRNLCPSNIVRIIKKFQIEYIQMVPTLMNRIINLPNISSEDLSSLKAMCHTGGVCSELYKQRWIDLIGAKKVYEIYSMTEVVGLTSIRGDEWLKHRRSVGKAAGGGQILIKNPKGDILPPNQVGEIFMKTPTGCFMTEYINQDNVKRKVDRFRSVGDLGYVDESGYLYFVNRRADLLITGGENVNATEVELCLLRHKDIDDAVVIGIPDSEWGQKIHAVIESKKDLTLQEVKEFLKIYLLPYKIPKSIEVVRKINRNENGKINRKVLIESYTKKKEKIL